jgi:hypothetical protein
VSYAAALAELFALDPDAVEAVTRPEGLSAPHEVAGSSRPAPPAQDAGAPE